MLRGQWGGPSGSGLVWWWAPGDVHTYTNTPGEASLYMGTQRRRGLTEGENPGSETLMQSSALSEFTVYGLNLAYTRHSQQGPQWGPRVDPGRNPCNEYVCEVALLRLYCTRLTVRHQWYIAERKTGSNIEATKESKWKAKNVFIFSRLK